MCCHRRYTGYLASRLLAPYYIIWSCVVAPAKPAGAGERAAPRTHEDVRVRMIETMCVRVLPMHETICARAMCTRFCVCALASVRGQLMANMTDETAPKRARLASALGHGASRWNCK